LAVEGYPGGSHGRKLRTPVVLAIALLLLGSCYFPGTATLCIYNKLSGSRKITALYVYSTGSADKGKSIISKPLAYDECERKWFVDPGDTTIEAEIDSGPAKAVKTMAVESAFYPWVNITDVDIQ
jgi:hypothetical protein